MRLVGRTAELERIDALLTNAGERRSGVLVLRGEAGIGKTALLRHAIDGAGEMTVARATGVESEAELEFSGLHEVCRPLHGWLDALSEHQAGALRVALGLEDGRQADRFAVGAATLALFAAAAEERPLLVVVDDAHWLDDGSVDALRFAARRLLADRVAMIVAVRDGDGGSFEGGFDELNLTGLDVDDARSLLGHVTTEPLADDVARHLWESTGGNPLALLELPDLLGPDDLGGHDPLRAPVPAGTGVERAFSRRLERLEPDCRFALVVLASSSTRELAPAVAALESLGLTTTALEPAEEAGLLELDAYRFGFRHPLLRAVAYQLASTPDRRRAHRALAEALTRAGDRDARAWHLAAAAVGPDEVAAAALAGAAAQARYRGGFGASSAAYERAARLSVTPSDALERLAGAAESAWEGGAAARAVALVDEGLAESAEPRLRARLLLLKGRISLQTGSALDARRHLTDAAALTEDLDPDATAGVLTYVVFGSHFEGRIDEALAVARHARALVPPDGSAADVRMDYVLGRSLLLAGHRGEGTRLLERMVESVRTSEHPARPRIAAAATVHSVLERPNEAEQLGARVIALARDEGPMALVYAMSTTAETLLRAGRIKRAVASATEGQALALELGQANIAAVLSIVLAHADAIRGDGDGFVTRKTEIEGVLRPAGMALPLEQLCCAEALLCLGLGDHIGAVELLVGSVERVASMGLYDRDVLPEPDLVEALVRLGRVDEARDVLAAWRGRRVPDEVALAATLADRCEALLAEDDDTARALFASALVRHADLQDVFGEARTRLCLGERLRRAGRRTDARDELQAALATFERLEAAPWADRARSELRASGARLRRRDEDRDELTPQELQVALQVAEGKTNKEVAAAMFLSPKTIEFHLARIFRKLGVSSRTELALRVASDGLLAVPA